ncbi:unnamed protein product [Pedinophyceae sp. YPF-701]|nr:unnamed protein product [Pedinophyceae sp. YPF-701]
MDRRSWIERRWQALAAVGNPAWMLGYIRARRRRLMMLEQELGSDASSYDASDDNSESSEGLMDEDSEPSSAEGAVSSTGSRGDHWEGEYTVHGDPVGPGRMMYADGGYMECCYDEHGRPEGAYRIVDPRGELRRSGEFWASAKRPGRVRVAFEDGGTVAAGADMGNAPHGRGTYSYPGGDVRVRGRWHHGTFVEGVSEGPTAASCGIKLRRGPGTPTALPADPLTPDPYEAWTVRVGASRIAGAGEGLFARRDVSAGELCALYSGMRCAQAEVDAREWDACENTLSLDAGQEGLSDGEDMDVDAPVMDVPSGGGRRAPRYCASLGHKANHSFLNNARYAPLFHPRHGAIKCVRAIKDIPAGQEITVRYDYDHGWGNWPRPNKPVSARDARVMRDIMRTVAAPEWYVELLRQWLCAGVPPALLDDVASDIPAAMGKRFPAELRGA